MIKSPARHEKRHEKSFIQNGRFFWLSLPNLQLPLPTIYSQKNSNFKKSIKEIKFWARTLCYERGFETYLSHQLSQNKTPQWGRGLLALGYHILNFQFPLPIKLQHSIISLTEILFSFSGEILRTLSQEYSGTFQKIGVNWRLTEKTLSGRRISEDNFDNNFKEAVQRQIDASIDEQLIHERPLNYAISQIQVDEAIAQIQTGTNQQTQTIFAHRWWRLVISECAKR